MYKRLILVFLISFSLSFPILGQTGTAPAVKAPVRGGGALPTIRFFNEQNQVVSLRSKIEPFFQLNQEQTEVFSFLLSIKFEKAVDGAELDQGSVFKVEQEILRVLIPGLRETIKVKFSDGTTSVFRVELNFSKVELLNRGCNTKSFMISVPDIKENFYIAASCKDIQGTIQASITIPQELNWGPSTVFETAGKGERWKLFNFNQLNLSNKTGEIGRITVLKEGVPTPCLIKFLPGSGAGTGDPKPPEPISKKKVALVRGSFGVSQQSIKTDDLNASGIGALVGFDGKYFPETSRFIMNGKYKSVLSTSNDGQAASLFQAGAGFSFGKAFGTGFSFIPFMNFNSFSSQAPKAKVNVVHSQVELDFLMLSFDEKLRRGWSLELFFSGYLPKADSTVLGLEFNYLFSTQGVGKGIFLNYLAETFEFKKSTTSDAKSKVASSQIQTGLLLHF